MKFTSRPLDMTQRILVDVLQTARSPDSYAVMLVDMTAVHAFRAQYKEERNVALTDLHVIIKASARSIRPDSSLNSSFSKRRGYQVLEPDSVDFGVSIATGRSVAPVVVLRNAERKTLHEIHDELKAGARKAIESEHHSRENGPPLWHRFARFAPSILRRAAIDTLRKSNRILRSKVGTVQITNLALDDFEFYLPAHMGTSLLISVGGTKLRPMVVDGQVEARQSVYISWQVDQRVVTAIHAARVLRRFKLLLANPQKLSEE